MNAGAYLTDWEFGPSTLELPDLELDIEPFTLELADLELDFTLPGQCENCHRCQKCEFRNGQKLE